MIDRDTTSQISQRWRLTAVAMLLGVGLMNLSSVAADQLESVTLHPPVIVQDAIAFLDGGTIAIRLKDGKGVTLDFCLDGRLRLTTDAQKPYHLFLGGQHPTDPRARELPVSGQEEKALLKLLKGAAVIEDHKRLVEHVIEVLEAR
jgi:hypothetical protein